MGEAKTVVVADDLSRERGWIIGVLTKNMPGQFAFHQAETGEEAVELCKANKPELVFLDINYGKREFNGVQAAREIWGYLPETRIVIMSSDVDDEFYVLQIRKVGGTSKAYGFIEKTATDSELVACVNKVLGGRRYEEPVSEVVDRILGKYTQLDAKKYVSLLCIAAGLSDKEISAKLDEDYRNVQARNKFLYQQLNITDADSSKLRARAIAEGYNRGLLNDYTRDHWQEIIEALMKTPEYQRGKRKAGRDEDGDED